MDPVVQPSVVSLFAGIGGFDLDFDHAGFRIVGHAEVDRHHARAQRALRRESRGKI